MFETDKPLEDMNMKELELTRRAWKADVERLLFPLLEALAIGWNASTRYERTRQFYDVHSGLITISTYNGKYHYDPRKGDYLNYLNVQVKAGIETVANLIWDYHSQSLPNGSWSVAEHLFARPADVDWVSEIENLCRLWLVQNEKNENQSEQLRKKKLLAILQKGEYV